LDSDSVYKTIKYDGDKYEVCYFCAKEECMANEKFRKGSKSGRKKGGRQKTSD
jgi:hypothetical protein